MDLPILDRSPEPLHEHVIQSGALDVHAEVVLVALQQIGKGFARQLAAMVRVEGLGSRFKKLRAP